jgi:poly-gamma-glutamate synthesis protein (capsule biosynthesis protein)
MGFGVMTVANNHSLDFGTDAFLDTLSLLRKRGILPIGGGHNLQEAWSPVTVKAGGLRVAFLGIASTLPPGFAADTNRAGIAPIHVTETYQVDHTLSAEQPGTAPFVHTQPWPEDIETAQAAVQATQEEADFVVVSIHWGVPPLWRPPSQGDLAEYQRPVGQALIEAGADLVVGHHPHSLQGIEVYQGKPIFHSLGNFFFDSQVGAVHPSRSRNMPYRYEDVGDRLWSESMILEVVLAPSRNVEYVIWPVLLDLGGSPHLLTGEDAQALIHRLSEMCMPFETQLVSIKDRFRLEL